MGALDGIVVDLFAGGGGASRGIQRAIGRDPDVAINHWPQAIAMHQANHPGSEHYLCSVWEADPAEVCRGRKVGLLWLSPDCTHFSKASGKKPKCRKSRSLASVAISWARAVRPRVIVLENVEEFLGWGPLDNDGNPIKAKKGQSFRNWLGKLKAQGYRVEYRLLVAADYGAPTTRRRLFLIARCDGERIVWPAPTHSRDGRGGLPRWRGAHEIIDWTDLGRSIFDREKPLVPKTMQRIAAGIRRYVLGRARPFIVPITHSKSPARVHGLDEPLRTITTAARGEFALITPFTAPARTHGGGGNDPRSVEEPVRTITCTKRGEFALVAPHLSKYYGTSTGAEVGEPVPTITSQGQHVSLVAPVLSTYHGGARGERRGQAPGDPLPTADTSNRFALVGATLVANYGERPDQGPRSADPTAPLGAVPATPKHAVVTAWVAKNFGGVVGQQAELPLGAITARDHHALVTAQVGAGPANRFEEVRAFLIAYYGATERRQMQQQSLFEPLATVPTKGRFAVVTVDGVEYEIADVLYRMLRPRELADAHDFGPDYVLDPPVDVVVRGKRVRRPLNITEQIECIGNSVPPPFAEAIVRANFGGELAREVA